VSNGSNSNTCAYVAPIDRIECTSGSPWTLQRNRQNGCRHAHRQAGEWINLTCVQPALVDKARAHDSPAVGKGTWVRHRSFTDVGQN